MLQIVRHPHPALRYASRPVAQIDDDLRAVAREMFRLMYEARGIGLAANQVGLPFRFFVLNVTADPEQKDQEQVFINPEIVKKRLSSEEEEGCLSFPGIYTKVRRPKRIRIRAYDLAGELMDVEADDLPARAIQHETEHLEGKLYIDYLGPLGRHSIKGKLREFEEEYRRDQAEGLIPSDDEIVRRLDAMSRVSAESIAPPATVEG